MPEMNREEIAKLEALYASNPEGRVFTHLAEAYRKAGEFERARSILELGLTKHPAYASAHVVLGRVYADLNETDQASASFRHVLELDPHNLVALRSLGELARSQGRTEEALHFFEELRHQDPSNTDIEGIITGLRQAPAAVSSEPPAPASEAVAAAAYTSNFEEIGIPGADGMADRDAPGPADAAPMDTLPGFEDSTPDYGDLVSPDIDLGWSAPSAQEALPGDLADFAGAAESYDAAVSEPAPENAPEALPEPEDEGTIETPIDLSDFEHIEEAPAFTSTEDPWSMTMDPALDTFDGAPAEAEAEAEPEPEPEAAAEPERADEEYTEYEVVTYTFESVMEVVEDVPVEAPPFEAPEPAAWEPPAEPEPVADLPLMTETMAELYTEQGLYDKAAQVYRALMAERPWDPDLPIRMADVEAKARGDVAPAPAPAPAAPEPEREEEIESPWMSGQAGTSDVPTPYAWTGDQGTEAAEEGPPISGYFRALLSWKPGERAMTAEAEPIMDLGSPVAEPEVVAEPEAPPAADPWVETPAVAAAPAPPAAAPVSDNPVEAAFDEWFNASDFGEETSQSNGQPEAPAESVEESGAAPEDDDDLEMFRSWLQSLKK